MKKNIVLIFLILLFTVQKTRPESSSGAAAFGTVIGCAVISGGTFGLIKLVKFIKKDRIHGDSVIVNVHSSIDSAEYCYSQDDYVKSDRFYLQIVNVWDEYLKYCDKRHIEQRITRDTLEDRISDCKLLQSLSIKIRQIEKLLFSIPDNADDIVLEDRHKILNELNYANGTIKLIEEHSGSKKYVVNYGFRKSLKYIETIDSLLAYVYEKEKLNFSLKCKFFYNRAEDSKDTSMLRQFVDDCDYYNVDKEWCQKAKISLGYHDTSSKKSEIINETEQKIISKPVKLNPIDSMHNDFKQAVEKRDISLLEQYIKRYSNRKFRKKESKIDSVNNLLILLTNEKKNSIAYLKEHPILSKANLDRIKIEFKGVDMEFQNIFQNVLNSVDEEMVLESGIRLPVFLTVDKRDNGTQFFMTGYVDQKKDIPFEKRSDTVEYSFTGCRWSAVFLHRLLSKVESELTKNSNISSHNAQLYRKSINSAVYIVRARKNENDNITMYAYGLQNTPVKFYTFFDITTAEVRNRRFDNMVSPVIRIGGSQADTLKNRLVVSFFN